MSKLLSQDEVDALLQGMSDGDVAVGPEVTQAGEVSAAAWDFANPHQAVRQGMPSLEVIHERFAGHFQDSLSAFLRRRAEVYKHATELRKFGEFVRSLIVPTSLHVFRPNPLRGQAMLVMSSQFVFNSVEIFFGGKGGSDFKIEGRDFTQIEQKFVARMVGVALKDIEKSWSPLFPMKPQLIRSEINPQFAQMVPPNEQVIVTTFEADLHFAKGDLMMCFPVATLEPVRDKLSQAYQGEDGGVVDSHWRDQLVKRLKEVEMDVVVELGRTHITGRELLALQAGDVLRLDRDISRPVTAKVAGVPKLLGLPGLSGSNKCIQISARVAE